MDATLQADKREGRGKNEARRLRASGRIPAVVYGSEKGKAVEIAVDPKTLLRILHSESGVNTLIGLQLDGGDTRVLGKEYQVDPIDHKLLHADFYQVAMDKTLTVTVPIVLKGEAKGVKLHPVVQEFEPNDPRMHPVYEACREMGLTVLSHTGSARGGSCGCRARQLSSMAGKGPKYFSAAAIAACRVTATAL
jgi:ribosomal protein L25 (general stress protein Ctc)